MTDVNLSDLSVETECKVNQHGNAVIQTKIDKTGSVEYLQFCKRIQFQMNGEYMFMIRFLPEDIMYMAWAVFKKQALYAFAKSFSKFEKEPQLTNYDKDMTKRMILKAYVDLQGNVGNVKHEDNLGTSTFQQIFSNCPENCRYAVVEVGGEFWVVDFWDAIRKPNLTIRMGSYHSFQTLDAATRSAILTQQTQVQT